VYLIYGFYKDLIDTEPRIREAEPRSKIPFDSVLRPYESDAFWKNRDTPLFFECIPPDGKRPGTKV